MMIVPMRIILFLLGYLQSRVSLSGEACQRAGERSTKPQIIPDNPDILTLLNILC